MYKDEYWWLRIALIIWDCIMSLFAFFIAGIIRFGSVGRFFSATNATELSVVIVLACVVAFVLSRMYQNFILRDLLRGLFQTIQYCFWIYTILLIYTFSTKNDMILSRLTLLYSIPIWILLIYLSHILIKRISHVYAKGKNGWKQLIITDHENVDETCRWVQKNNGWKNNAIGVVLFDDESMSSKEVFGVPRIDVKTDIMDYIRKNPVDEVLISTSPMVYQTSKISEIVNELMTIGTIVSIKVPLPNFEIPYVSKVSKIGATYTVSFAEREYDYLELVAKRIMDILGGLVGLLITFLVSIVVVPAILLESPGPILFKQKRVGRNGRIFTMYKFRSMCEDAETKKGELLKQNEMKGLLFKMSKDPRITRVGKFIRKTSIDELPQFFNILIGDMSLVGTRPPTLDEYEKYTSYHKKRLSFKPGLTGIWQTSGRNNIDDFDTVMQMDLKYIREWSILLDIRLLIKTLKIVFLTEGAQ